MDHKCGSMGASVSTCRTEDASKKSIMGASLSVCNSKEKAKLRPASTLSKLSLQQTGHPDADIAMTLCYGVSKRSEMRPHGDP